VRVPALPEIDLAVPQDGDVEAAVARKVERRLRRRSATDVLAAHETGTVSARMAEVETPKQPGQGFRGGHDPDDPAILAHRGTDLTAQAASGQLGRLDRRDELVTLTLVALAREERCSVLLVGPSDVGKSALINELAVRLHEGSVPEALRGRRLVRLTANELIAGAQYTGMWQGFTRDLIEQARKERTIVAMGDPAGIIDAGRWS